MLTLINEPQRQAFSGSFICFQLKAMETPFLPYAAQGVFGRIVFNTLDPQPYFQTGETFTISWNTGMEQYSVSFTAVANPTADNEVPDQSWSGLPFHYFQEVRKVFESNPLLSTFFTIEQNAAFGSTLINIRAKEVDANWSITMDKGTVSKNSIDFQETNTISEDTTPPNYKVRFEVFFQEKYKAGGFRRVACSEATPNRSGLIAFDVGQVLHQELLNSYTPQLLAADANELVIADNRRQYYVRYAEIFGSPAELQAWATLETHEVVAGRVDLAEREDGNLLDLFNGNNAFFSFSPKRKTIDEKQPEFLHWYNWTESIQSIALQVIETDDQLQTTTKYLYTASPITAESGATVTIPVGVISLAIADATLRYSVQVVKQNSTSETLSQARVYTVGCEARHCLRYMAYLNGFLLPEILRLTGETKKELNVDRVLSERISNCSKIGTHSLMQSDFDFQNEYRWRTGFLSKAQVEALQEMLIYNDLYELQADGYVAVLLTGSKYPITECFQFLHFLEFDGIRSLRQTAYFSANIFGNNASDNGSGNGGNPPAPAEDYEVTPRKDTFELTSPYSVGQVITLSRTPQPNSKWMLFRNGNQKLREGTHYTVSGKTISFLFGNETVSPASPDQYDAFYQSEDGTRPIGGFDFKKVSYPGVYGPSDRVTLDNVPLPNSTFIVKDDALVLREGRDYSIDGSDVVWNFSGSADSFRIWSQREGANSIVKGFLNDVFFLTTYSNGTSLSLSFAPIAGSVIINWDAQHTVMTLEEGVHYTVNGQQIDLLFSADAAYFDVTYAV